jgi:hypothetical protein
MLLKNVDLHKKSAAYENSLKCVFNEVIRNLY